MNKKVWTKRKVIQTSQNEKKMTKDGNKWNGMRMKEGEKKETEKTLK